MRIAVYGGSFNPPHVGHAMVASWVRWADLADEVWLMPAANHAFGKQLPDFSDRVRWCEALAGSLGAWARVTSIEQSLGSPSYTLHALDALSARNPGGELRLLIGADNVPQLPRWHRWGEIKDRYDPLVVGRAGYERWSPEGAPVFPGVSSTEVRRRLADGESVSGLVPASVLRAMR
ncbi:MAG: nicotinate-nucleotide adenylyltransferase [Kiritimatiellia bacterium]|jgi:nicotinate-nucleotide adenylyltransferase